MPLRVCILCQHVCHVFSLAISRQPDRVFLFEQFNLPGMYVFLHLDEEINAADPMCRG